MFAHFHNLLPSDSSFSLPMPISCSVAVIGAGVSGLSAARELLREGHRVVVFEKSSRIGGTWVYDPHTDSDTSGLDPTRQVVHGSLYRSLRTNLPRPLMGFSDYPFPDPESSFGDPRAFPGHGEVLAFIQAFAREEGVLDVVRFGVEVITVKQVGKRMVWAVEWRRAAELPETEVFEAVVVCNGHHTQPRFAHIPGIENWPGKQIHSHNYRIPEPFQDQVVVIIGMGASGFDISHELCKLAKEVHLASRSSSQTELGKLDNYQNIWQHLMIKCVHEDGSVEFEDGSEVVADIILHCTGYNFSFPFFEDEIVSIDDNRVGPLFKHVFPPRFAPCISFVGLTSKTIIFLMIEIQSKWVAKILSGKVALPSQEDMLLSVKEHYSKMEEIQRPKHHTHSLIYEPEYLNWLAAEVGMLPIEEWKVKMYWFAMKCIISHDGGYRDRWDVDGWISLFVDHDDYEMGII